LSRGRHRPRDLVSAPTFAASDRRWRAVGFPIRADVCVMAGRGDTGERGREMSRSTAALFGGASLVTTAGLDLPHARLVDVGGLVLVAAVAGLVACGIAWWRERVPVWMYPQLAVLGTALVSLGLFFNGERHGGPVGSDEMYYLWVVLWCAYYFTRRVLAVQVMIVLAACAVTLALVESDAAGISRWISLSGLVVGAAVVVRMLSERRDQLMAELRSGALSDPLTGLPNRRALEAACLGEAARQGRGRPFALLLIDLDHFKQLNDEHGHKAGDRALVEVAVLLRAHARDADIAARLGGDEFALLLSDTDDTGATSTKRRLEHALREHAQAAGWPGGASIGTAVSNVDGVSLDDLMRRRRHANVCRQARRPCATARLPEIAPGQLAVLTFLGTKRPAAMAQGVLRARPLRRPCGDRPHGRS
jgi:diguanylate cyclase (GGDEF)-like protein